MKTLLTTLLLATALALVGVPGVVGLLATPRITALTDHLDGRMLHDTETVAAVTQRGWFASRTNLTLDVHHPLAIAALHSICAPVADARPTRVEVHIVMHHGPLVPDTNGRRVPALAGATTDVFVLHGDSRTRLPIDINVRRGFADLTLTARWDFAARDAPATGHLELHSPLGADNSPVALLARGTGDAFVTLPASALDALLASLENERGDLRYVHELGYVRREGDIYVSELTLRDGRLVINEQPVPLPL